MPNEVTMVPVGELTIADDNVRFEVGNVDELAQSIEAHGIIEPLIATPEKVLVAGARRLAGAKQAGMKVVPVILRPFSDRERLEVMLIENLQREDLSPIEEARAYQRLRSMDLSQREIAAKVGRAQGHVSKRLSLLALPEETLQQVDQGAVQVADALEIAKVVDDVKLVKRLTKKAAEGGKHVALDVSQALETKGREKKASDKFAELKKSSKVPVFLLVSDEWGYNVKTPEGMALVKDQQFATPGVVNMEPGKHAKLKCHAIGVVPRDSSTIAVCTDPSRHPDPNVAAESKRQEVQRELAEKREAEEAMSRHRMDWLVVAAQKPTKEQVLELAFFACRETGWHGYDIDEIACRILGIEVLDVDEDSEEIVAAEAVDEYAEVAEIASTPAGKLRVTFAWSAALLEANDELESVIESLGYERPDVAQVLAAEAAKAAKDGEPGPDDASMGTIAEAGEEQQAVEEVAAA